MCEKVVNFTSFYCYYHKQTTFNGTGRKWDFSQTSMITTLLRCMQFFILYDFSTFPIPYFRLKNILWLHKKDFFPHPFFIYSPSCSSLIIIIIIIKNSTLMCFFAQSKNLYIFTLSLFTISNPSYYCKSCRKATSVFFDWKWHTNVERTKIIIIFKSWMMKNEFLWILWFCILWQRQEFWKRERKRKLELHSINNIRNVNFKWGSVVSTERWLKNNLYERFNGHTYKSFTNVCNIYNSNNCLARH